MLTYEIIIIVLGIVAIIALDLMGKNKNWGALGMLLGLATLITVMAPSTLWERIIHGFQEAWVAPIFVMSAGFATDYFQQSGAMSVLSRRIGGIWSLGIIVFVLSMFFDNTVATLIGLSLVSITRGHAAFATIVAFWALLGGLFSPIGDITTLMLWLSGKLTATGVIFGLGIPALAGYVAYTYMLRKDIDFKVLKNERGSGGITELGIAAVLFLTIPALELTFHISPGFSVIGVALASFVILRLMGHKIQPIPHDPKELTALKKTSIYIALVLFSVGLITPDLEVAKEAIKNMPLSGIFTTSLVVSSHVDNIPWTALMINVLSYAVDSFEWLVIAIGVGLGGGLSPIGSTSTLLSSSTMGIGFKGFYQYALKMLLAIGIVVGVLYLEKVMRLI